MIDASRAQRGQVTLFVVVIVAAVLMLAGLVVDGGSVLAARRRAIDEAGGAARAAAQALAGAAYRDGAAVMLDPERAAAAAQSYLAATGHRGDVQVDGDQVAVRVSFDQDTALLGIIGIDTVAVTGRGRARAVRGVETGEGP